MNKRSNESSKTLRERAEQALLDRKRIKLDQLSEVDVLNLVHELQVHQVELELQNEELVQAHSIAQQSANRYTELYDFSPTGYFTISQDGLIEELNLSGAKLFGETRSDTQGQPFEKFLSLKSRDPFSHFIQYIGQRKVSQICEVDINYLNVKRTLYLTGVLGEKQEEYFISATDISDLKAMEQKLSVALNRAEESDRLKTSFLQNLRHEIRTPANAIVGFSIQLMEPDISDKNTKEFASIVYNSTNQLLTIINDIIALSLLETKQVKINESTFLLNDLLSELHTIFKSQAEHKNLSLKLTIDQSEKNTRVVTDKSKLSQVLTNLLSNALKFTQEGEITYGYVLTKSGMVFFVTDTGIGVDVDMREKIFERFRQANTDIERKYGGTGLGLSISKALVELLGGKIWVESNPNQGATFKFNLPFSVIGEHGPTPARSISGAPVILMADDLLLNRKYFDLIVSKNLKYKIFHAKDGKEAIQMVRDHPEINLVLMDINMPVMSGIEASVKIKEFRPDMYIIAQTGYDLSAEGGSDQTSGFDDFVSKPIDAALLAAKLKALCND